MVATPGLKSIGLHRGGSAYVYRRTRAHRSTRADMCARAHNVYRYSRIRTRPACTRACLCLPNKHLIRIIPDLPYMDWPLAKARSYRGPLHGWHFRILINALLVRNRGISAWMTTPHTLRRPLLGVEPATYRSLWNSE